MLDAHGDEVSERIPVVVEGDPLTFTVDHALTFRQFSAGIIRSVRVIDADGRTHDVPLATPDARD
jgi:hypothetical protein